MVGSVYCSRRHSISLRSYLSLSKKRHAISNFLVPIAEVLSYVEYVMYDTSTSREVSTYESTSAIGTKKFLKLHVAFLIMISMSIVK